ncbi:MAG: 4a-hydroxytetrahydrobiopterin dehydratase [Candidatus Sumerlaeia bacterium]|nr:4a-hydroxytetrahydrobiopterin dehydratase [Candidatus Sumerlaeia bacterium]
MPGTEGKGALDPAALADALMQLPDWEPKGKQIVKTYAFPDFDTAVEFTNQAAEVCRRLNHFPEIALHHKKVKVVAWTPKYQAVSELDTQFAAQLEKLYEQS